MRRLLILVACCAVGAAFLPALGAHAQAPAPAPACLAGTTPAVEFKNLRLRVPFGADESYTLKWTREPGATQDVELALREHTTGRVFSTEDINEFEKGPFGVTIDVDDPPTDVILNYTEVTAGVSCLRQVVATVSGYRHFTLPARCELGTYRPPSVLVSCAGAATRVRGVRWRGWNKDIAKGSGKAGNYGVRLRAYRPRSCGRDASYRYTRLLVSYVGSNRPPGRQRFTQRFSCAS